MKTRMLGSSTVSAIDLYQFHRPDPDVAPSPDEPAALDGSLVEGSPGDGADLAGPA